MQDKQQILRSITKLAKKLGRAPRQHELLSEEGITWYSVSQFFPKWSDAVKAAGLQPYTRNARREDSELLRDWGETVRKKGAIPQHRAYGCEGKYDPRTIDKRFGRWSRVPQAFRDFAKGKREWADVLALLPARVPRGHRRTARRRRANDKLASAIAPRKTWCAKLKNRPIYGNPTPCRWLRHEPVNEQGVVLLFGMLAKHLGYLVEHVHKGFPDCEALRQIAPGRWQRVRIEFEFESKNYRDHGHPPDGCDVIVCWRHNWPACPKHIDVLELARVIQSSAASQ